MSDDGGRLTRRGLFQRFGAAARPTVQADWVSARGREAAVATGAVRGTAERPIRLDSTESPLGASPHVVEIVLGTAADTGRSSSHAQQEPALVQAIATRHGIAPRDVVLGVGSSEIIDNAVRAFTSASRPLVIAVPTFEQPREAALKSGSPVRAVPVDAALRIDLEQLLDASAGAGLVYLCNPHNPTGTTHTTAAVADFVARARAVSPETVVLIDEAYHDYVIDRACGTSMPLAVATPNVIVTRTLSKAYGLAGLRVGYAVGPPAMVQALTRARMPFSMSPPALRAAVAALADVEHVARERARNAEVRAFTMRTFGALGFGASESSANFVFVDLRRPAAAFRDACRKAGVLVGRDFPPYGPTHCRISIGTMEEMQEAMATFTRMLDGQSTPVGRPVQ